MSLKDDELKEAIKAVEESMRRLAIGSIYVKATEGYEGDLRYGHDPELLKKKTEELIKNSRFYEPPKEEHSDWDSGWDD